MSAPKKLSDAAVLGAISAHEVPARSGPTQQDLAVMLGVSIAGIQPYLKALLRSGAIERSGIRGYILTNGTTKAR